jgi:predicted ATPase/class 3 adenylate cyclase/DNA-binding XRE family transcriptional regulator
LAEVSFGEWLKRQRKTAGLTQDQLALQISCSTSALKKIEAEERRPSAQIVERLAEIFDIPPSEQTLFLRFARGDWKSAPMGIIENAPWLVSHLREHNDLSNPKIDLITFLFTDIEHSAKLWESAPEQMKVALKRHHVILQEAITSNGGTVFQIVGDAFCAAFLTVASAISAALTAQSELYQEEWDLPFPIRVRMGIHTGAAERTSNNPLTGGYESNQTLNRVARILQAGHGRQILLSLATKELAKDSLPAGTELRDMGKHHLKNLIRTEHLFQLQIAGLPSDFPPLNTLNFHRHNLPVQLTSFIGREQEIIQVREYLSNDDIRLVTLIGPPGIGKTRLSIEAARVELSGFPAGVFFVALAPLEDPNLVAPTISQTLGFVEIHDRSPFERLKDGIGNKQMLIVLDNVEHIIEVTATLVSDLLSVSPRLKILTTSREALRIPGEWLYQVPALSTPAETQLHSIDMETALHFAAVKLFSERARAVRSDFALNADNVQTVAQICTQLDGLPLAIELIAARIRLMSPQTLLSNFSDQFVLSADGMRAVSARQKTLHNAIAWSYDLLPDQEQDLFRRLSVFVGGWTLEEAQAVCSGEGLEANEVPDLLMHLVDKSLVIAREQEGEERYQTLEIIHQYARGKLWAAGKREMMRQQHLAYFVDLAERAEPNLRAFDMVMWLDRLEVELDNIRAALAWAQENDVEVQLRLASALLWFWHIRGHKNEGVDWLERGLSLEAAERGGEPLTPEHAMIRGKALNASGTLMVMWHEIERSSARLEESLALFQGLGPVGKQGMAYALLGLVQVPSIGRPSNGSMLEESLSLFNEVGDKFGAAECLLILTGLALEYDDYKQAIIFGEEQLALRRDIGDQDGIAMALHNLGGAAFGQGDYELAITLHEESLAIFLKVGNKGAMGLTLSTFGDRFLWQGNYERAAKTYEEALAFAQDTGDRYRIAYNYYNLGAIASLQGDYIRATQMIIDSLAVFRDLHQHWLVASSLHTLGDIALAQGSEERATRWYEAELDIGQNIQLDLSIIFALGGLGKVAWAQGDYDLATERFEEGLRMSREIGPKPAICYALYGFGRVAQSRRDYVAARAFYTEVLEIMGQPIGPPYKWSWLKTHMAGVAYPLSALAAQAVAQNQMEQAACLLGAAETLYSPLRFEMSAAERAEHDQAVAAARATLGEEAFAAAYDEGGLMTMEQAIQLALS